MIVKFKIGVFLIGLLLSSCGKNQLELYRGEVYFQFEYINHAWGFNHSGFYITPSGQVFTYDKSTPWIFAVTNHIQRSDLLSNIGASTKRDTLINLKVLAHYQSLAFMAKDGKMSELLMRGADMGATLCKVIVLEPSVSPNEFREVILSQKGDIETHNLKSEAVLITNWLNSLHFH